jgi:hypothetical protein
MKRAACALMRPLRVVPRMTGMLSGRLFMIISFLSLLYSPASWHH